MDEKFARHQRGDRLTASEINSWLDVIERAATLRGGTGASLRQAGGQQAITVQRADPIVLVRLLVDMVPVEGPRSIDQQGDVALETYTAMLQVRSEEFRTWVDAEGGEVDLVNPYNMAFDQDELVACYFSASAGFYVPIPHHGIRIAITCLDPYGEGDDGIEGWYPSEDDTPNVYPASFADVPFDPVPGAQPLEAVAKQPLGPHITVCNLCTGEGTFLPEGTLIWCFRSGGQWYTYAQGVFQGQGGSSGSSGSGASQGDLVVTNVCPEFIELDLEALPGGGGILGPASGGTGLDGSSAPAASLLMGTGTGYALGSLAPVPGSSVTISYSGGIIYIGVSGGGGGGDTSDSDTMTWMGF